MEKQYYYLNGQTRVGPISLDALKGAPITGSSLVWHDSLRDWTEASTLPELSSLFARQAAPSTPPLSYAQASGPTTTQIPPPMPDNYLVWAILSTVCCCLILGIVSIVYSTQVNTLYAAGNYEGAKKASTNAKNWAIASAISVAGIMALYMIFLVVIAISIAVRSNF